ncbi:MAG TPA: XRE family transcriptional regulator [Spirochaetia bacterium]|jgi:transcriptional regulator with XRE-family HTH domain|nr:XRE family transcriptional regulator [Spirochaetia bacterium]
MKTTSHPGVKVKSIRETKKMSPEELCERAGISLEELAQIESGELIPGMGPFIKIAQTLGVRLGTFMDDADDLGPVLTRSGNSRRVVRFANRERTASSDLDFYALASNKSGRHMEPFTIDIHPTSKLSYSLSSHEGEEFIYVLSGIVEIKYGKDTYILHAGDSIYYDSIVPHHVHSAGDISAKILAVIYAP